MRKARTLLFLAPVAATSIFASVLFHPAAFAAAVSLSLSQQSPQQSPPQSTQHAPTVASVVDRDINGVEELIINAADAMPEDKFNFTPAALNIPGADYKGVRSFAGEVKHIAASNWLIWSSLTGDALPEGLKDGNGPANLQSKADIIKFLRDSFALGHRAAATLTTENMLQSPAKSKSTRLRLAEFGVAHAYDHYGQMVEYLRMNGIVPPASRDKSE
jgi:hypothetical protein